MATTISDIKKQEEETKAQLELVNESIKEMESSYQEIEEEMGELDAKLVELMASVQMIAEEVSIMEEKKAVVEASYQKALAEEQMQYEAMKDRIRFMYEKGDSSYWELLISGDSLTNIVNKLEYAEKVYAYDRDCLEAFKVIVVEVAALKEELEIQSAELEVTMKESMEEQESLEQALLEKRATSDNYEELIASASAKASEYKKQMSAQQKEIERLEELEEEKYQTQNAVTQIDPSVITSATGSALGKEIATFATGFVGNPYVYGGTSLTNGCDCSGFTQSIYKAYGYSIPRTSTDQRSAGVSVSYSDAQPGDIICYSGHVAIYLGSGMIVHASTEKTGIIIGTATYRTILSVRRII
jgi:cell wall-associated NlpC family hydrolase